MERKPSDILHYLPFPFFIYLWQFDNQCRIIAVGLIHSSISGRFRARTASTLVYTALVDPCDQLCCLYFVLISLLLEDETRVRIRVIRVNFLKCSMSKFLVTKLRKANISVFIYIFFRSQVYPMALFQTYELSTLD